MSERFYDNLMGFSDLKYADGVLYGRLNGGAYQEIPTRGADGDDGDDGVNAYLYIAYASDDQGTAFSLIHSDALKYIALLQSTTVISSPIAPMFAGKWHKYLGDDGQDGEAGSDGADGLDAYVYVAYASDASGTAFNMTPSDSLKYRAEIHVTAPIASPSLSDFSGAVWVKYIGDDGQNLVTSVNSQTGAVVLDAEDVGAEPSGAVSTHNTAAGAHSDLFGGKVDKVTGKGLSTEDYTTAEKTKLSGIAAGAEVNVNADWNATSGDAQILNKPTIPDAQIQADWNQATDTAKDFIKNKPTIPAAQVQSDWNATSGMGQILNKPTIPSAQVNSDWNSTSGLSQILNKPTIPANSSFTLAGLSEKSYNSLTDKPTLGTAASKDVPASGNASSAQAVLGNDTRLSDARTPAAHTHAYSDITGLTASRVAVSDATGKLSASGITATTLGYLDATSSIQTQLNAKQATISGAATTIATSNLTASYALVSNSSGKVAVSAVTANELGYLSGVTSAVQTQLNGKSNSSHTHSNYLTDAASDGNEYVRKNGAWSVASGGVSLATTSTAGIVQIGTNISVSSGVISVATATTSVLGVAKFSSSNFIVSSGSVSIRDSSTSYKGVALAASSAEVTAGTSTDVRTFTPAQIKSMVETFAPPEVPPGCVLSFAGSGSVPSGFLLCNGAAVSRTTYANLYSAIGTTYGTGDGSTTFNIPDFRGRFLRGYDGTRSAAIGTAQADGLPNITGSAIIFRTYYVADQWSGAFSCTAAAYARGAAESPTVNGAQTLSFSASNSSSIYGNSSYVTPYNYAVQFIIKY